MLAPQHWKLVPLSQLQALPGLSLQAPQVQLLVHTWCEHDSQLPCLVLPGAHTPCPLQVPQVQAEVQVRVPQLPQACLLPGVHVPWPLQLLQGCQVQLLPQVRCCVPQLPQACDCVLPGVHSPPPHALHALHVQFGWHTRVCVPQLPQPCEPCSPALHSP